MAIAIAKPAVLEVPGLGVPFALGFFLAFRTAITFLGFQSDPLDGTAVSISVSCAFVFLAWCVTGIHQIPSFDCRTARWIGAYLAFVVISLLWSDTKSTGVAMLYWLGIAADCTSIYLLALAQDFSRSILRGFVIGAAIVGLIAWSLPTLPDLRIGNEDFLHPNAVGYVLAISTLLALDLSRHSRVYAFMGALTGVTLLRTLSKASIAGFAAAVVFYMLRDSHLARRVKIWIGVAAALVIGSSWGLLEAYATTYDQGNHIETLTGRTYIWAVAWEEALKAPWIGHGFYSFRFLIPAIGDFEPWQAHNELLQQFFCYGVVGLLIFLGLYISFVRQVCFARHGEFATVAGALMLFAVIRGLVDTDRFDVNFPLWLLTFFVVTLRKTRLEPR